MVQLPFSAQEFFATFGRYNHAIWPMQWVFYGLAALLVVGLMQGVHRRLALLLLASFWVWMALVYHLGFFADINPAARAFAIVFVLEAVALGGVARTRAVTPPPAPAPRPAAVTTGKALIAYALFGYPLVGYLAGQRYPEMPLLGAPCPTTIFTIGALIWAFDEVPWWVLAVPVAWAVIATSAALQLGVTEDLGLTVAGLCGVIFARKRHFLNQPGIRPAT